MGGWGGEGGMEVQEVKDGYREWLVGTGSGK